MAINISHRVTLFPQPTGMSCWSAAATMLSGNQSVGPGSARLEPGGGLADDFGNIRKFAIAHGLRMEAPQSWTVDGLAMLLRRGPLWVAGAVPSSHAYVVAAMKGDGTPAGTMVTIYDPWPPNIGQIVQVSYAKLISTFPTATTYILHR